MDRGLTLEMPSRTIAAGLGLTGLVAIVVGTFLPWLRSGQTHRNSYQTGGAIKQVLGLPGPLDTALSVWPFLGLACGGVIALFALGLHRLAAVTALIAGLCSGAVAVGVLTVDGSTFAVPENSGPAVTLIGAISVLGAATVLLSSRPLPLSEGDPS